MFDPKAVAIVGVGAIMPDAPSVQKFWENIKAGRYSITDVPQDRWRADLYYDPDPHAPDKTYSKIGAWVKEYEFEPMKWGIPIPPSVLAVMDGSQKWGIATARQALLDYGYPQRSLDPERVAVILGNALSGENHYRTSLRIHLPDFMESLTSVDAFRALPEALQKELLGGLQQHFRGHMAEITEDTMPGELGNVIAGRIANVFNFSGPNFVTDAACASSHAAIQAAVDGLFNHQFDAVLTGGVDHNMGVEGYVKFSKIGALSPDGSRPFADGANGFVMGEGAAIFLLKRLEDAERAGDHIYAVIRGIGASSDGRGKGITAPNPIGQQRAIERAWKNAGLNPASVGLIEAHGTSTRVGDVAEVTSLNSVFGSIGLAARSVALGSVKSNIGHLKSAAGAAGLLKTILALGERVLPPSVNFDRPNPNIAFDQLPFFVNTTLQPWEKPAGEIRRAGISSFGFGGTNFHMVVEEWVPGLLTSAAKTFPAVQPAVLSSVETIQPVVALAAARTPYRGIFFAGADTPAELAQILRAAQTRIAKKGLPPIEFPAAAQRSKPERLAIDYNSVEEFNGRVEKALKALETENAAAWQALTAQGIYRGRGKAGKTAFLFPGQGSQYVNMLKDLCAVEPIVAETFQEADAIMTPILGRSLTSYIYVDGDADSLKQAEEALRDTAITQPAMLTANVALLRLMQSFGYTPDLVIGHSLGEYAALVAAGVLEFAEALEIVSARGQEMKKVSMDDNGGMAAVSAPLEEVQRILEGIPEYVVIANINSPLQCVVGGSTPGITAALQAFEQAGYQATRIPVSHAFHTRIVAPASGPLKTVIARMSLHEPQIPVIANVTGELYPHTREEILDILGQQVASPVQFIRGMETLYAHGVRNFVEVGPKRVLNALSNDILKGRSDVTLLSTNHPRKGAVISFNEALCGLLAAGVIPHSEMGAAKTTALENVRPSEARVEIPEPKQVAAVSINRAGLSGSVVISGAGLGLPGKQGHVFADDNIERILKGEILIESFPAELREGMLQRHITRVEKSESGAHMLPIDDLELTIKLGGQRGAFDLSEEFGIPAERVEACDISTQLAIAAGIEALRDAGIPLVMRYRRTSKGTYLPDRWKLPEALADETGVIFASAFPGVDRMAEEAGRFAQSEQTRSLLNEVEGILSLVPPDQPGLRAMLRERAKKLAQTLESQEYHFDRRFVFRILAMGHSQFAEYIGARGPNTAVNAACATTTHAIAIAEDWIRAGRARRVVVVSGDDVTSGSAAPWLTSGLLASGAATIAGDVRHAALPFDRRRNGMIMGMGAAALVVESEDAVRERGMRALCEVLATQIANSAYHGTRLDVQHVREVMQRLVAQAEERFGLDRQTMAAQTMFMSHETYTPARGGSASAEIHALRHVFGEQANQVVIANTKGFTGHAMGVGIEDVVAVKALETGVVPPIANLDEAFEPDPELGDLNLSHGGKHPVQYALRLGAGFGSQIAMALLRAIPLEQGRVNELQYQDWLAQVAGYEHADLEVEKRTLRIRHAGPPTHRPLTSTWQPGMIPSMWADYAGETVRAQTQPAAPVPASVPAPEIAAVAPQRSGSVDEEAVKAFVLDQVSQKTGYPVEMLDLDLDLEADLGIDTVKQAELFAAIREHYTIPRREDLRLTDYNTLEKIVAFMCAAQDPATLESVAREPQSIPAAELPVTDTLQPADGEPVLETGSDAEAVKAFVLEQVSQKTGYPVEMLDLELDLEADLGIDTVKQAELFAALREHYAIPRREDLRLAEYNTLGKVVAFMAAAQEPVEEPLESVLIEPTHAEEPQVSAPNLLAQPAETAHLEALVDEEVKAFVLAQVSEKTGYPIDMLDVELDLEADLGIDTVKQAELFAAVRTHYGIPRREDLRLADYNTLAKVIEFVITSRSQAEVEAALPAITETLAEQKPSGVVIRRCEPVVALRPRLDLCIPTGVRLDETARVLVVGEKSKLSDALVKKLKSRKVQVERIAELTEASLIEQLEQLQKSGPIQGVYFLAAASAPESVWAEPLGRQVEGLYHVMRALKDPQFVVGGLRMGGLLGYGEQAIPAPIGAAVSGFIKALVMERPELIGKVVDFPEDFSAPHKAELLIAETLHDSGAVEIGYEGERRFTISLVEQAAPDNRVDLGEHPVFIVTGGSGGIAVPIVIDLARKTQGTFYLLGRTPLSQEDPTRLLRVLNEREIVKQELVETLKSQNVKATPVQVEQQLFALERAASAVYAIQSIQAAGGSASYVPCDVTDEESVRSVYQQVLAEQGRVDVVIHAAGIERSRKLENKPLVEFQQTLAIKLGGFRNLELACEQTQRWPKVLLSFGSVAGRFGNSGHTDYAAANNALVAFSRCLQQTHPATRAVVLDWTAWAEVGMASRGNISRLMRMAGIDLLEADQAAPLVYRELTAGTQGEVLLAGSFGILEKQRRVDGGLDVDKANTALRAGNPAHVMLSRVSGLDLYAGILLEAELDPKNEPFLQDHALNDIPLLPGVMGIEGFSVVAQHVASTLGASHDPLVVVGLEDIEFLTPLKFYRDESRRITWKTQVFRTADGLTAHVMLQSTLALKVRPAETVVHFKGKVHFHPVAAARAAETTTPPHWNGHYTVAAEEIYRLYFHGPVFQVLEGVQRSENGLIAKIRNHMPKMSSSAVQEQFMTAPLLLEACLQTAGAWEIGATGILALPKSIGDLRLFDEKPNGIPLFAEVNRSMDGDAPGFDARVVDANGQVYLEVCDYRTSSLSYAVEDSLAEPMRKLIQD